MFWPDVVICGYLTGPFGDCGRGIDHTDTYKIRQVDLLMFSREKKHSMILLIYVPEVSSMFPHVDIERVLPFCNIPTLGAHKVLVTCVSQHVFGEVGHIAAPEVTQTALVRLLA